VWWDRSEPLEVYLSESAVGRAATSTAPAHWVETSGLDVSLQHMATWLDAGGAPDVRRVRVWLSASLARPCLVSAASGARNKREAHALAAAMARDATGIDGEVRLWLDRWRPGESMLAVAIPAEVWNGLQDVVGARNALRAAMPRNLRSPAVELVSLRPWWNLPFDALIAESRSDASRVAWSLSEGAGILHGVIERGSVTEIGFDRPGLHDPTGVLLRRRLQVNWGVTSTAQHLLFERHASGSETPPLPIGAWRRVAGGGA
jgi:hypothetical protein